MAELTPMMQQYRTVKERNPDCILFFRLGDFYEMFDVTIHQRLQSFAALHTAENQSLHGRALLSGTP